MRGQTVQQYVEERVVVALERDEAEDRKAGRGREQECPPCEAVATRRKPAGRTPLAG